MFPGAAPASHDFSPSLVRLQEKPPSPLGRKVIRTAITLFCIMMLWAVFGRLDIVAVANGKLVPQTYLKIVQPAEQGIVKDILVKEGESVKQGQVLMRMDATLSEAQCATLSAEYHRLRLTLRRIDAELGNSRLNPEKDDPADLYSQILAQFNANRRAYESSVSEQRSALEKAEQEMAAAREIKVKLEQVLPHYREQNRAYEQLSKEGYVARLDATDKKRELIEREQDLKSQEYVIKSARAVIGQTRKRLAQIAADYRRQLQTERVITAGEFEKVHHELAQQQHRKGLLELKAPQDGVIKDLATHTVGTVVSQATILMTLVPLHEPLKAEVWVSNEDIGFVRPGQPVKLKISSYTFQKYGMINGMVEQVSADASDGSNSTNSQSQSGTVHNNDGSRLFYRTLVRLDDQHLVTDGTVMNLSPGMQLAAEIKLGTRSVLEYLFSPVTKAFHEAGRER
ncbi:MAG TPA: HlyD family type I secretion periplasmic adaptor subunit [Geobacteraceae bacterium]|nr:HlyD family type I secretion periplasmic adaptor subunit [Geobacteraceae bacterium]